MKTFAVLLFAIITLVQLVFCLQDVCGKPRIVQVSVDGRNASRLHFPWAGALYSSVNRTQVGDMKYICGATLLTKAHSVTGKQQMWKRPEIAIIMNKFQPGIASSTSIPMAIKGRPVMSFCISECSTWSWRAQQVSRSKKYFCIPIGIRWARIMIPTSQLWRCAMPSWSPAWFRRFVCGPAASRRLCLEQSLVGRNQKPMTRATSTASTIRCTTTRIASTCQSDPMPNAFSRSRGLNRSRASGPSVPVASTAGNASRSGTLAHPWQCQSTKAFICAASLAHLSSTSPAAITSRSLSSPTLRNTKHG